MTGHVFTGHAVHIHQLQDGLGHRILDALRREKQVLKSIQQNGCLVTVLRCIMRIFQLPSATRPWEECYSFVAGSAVTQQLPGVVMQQSCPCKENLVLLSMSHDM